MVKIMNKNKIGEFCGVNVVLSKDSYEEYKGTLNEQIEELQQRIDKAIWYINRCKEYHRIHHHEEKMYPDELISLELILKGEWEDLGEDSE